MKLKTEPLPGSKVKVVMTAEAEDLDKAFQKTYQRIAQQARIPGFRRGKAPVGLIKRHYSDQVIRELAWNSFVEDVYLATLAESDLRPIFQPEIPQLEDFQEFGEDFGEGHEFQIETVMTVHPRPKLPDYKSLKLLKAAAEVSEEELDEQLERLREGYAEELEVDRDTVAEGDLVRVALKVLTPDSEQVLEESESEFVADRNSDQPVASKLSGHLIGQTVTDQTTIANNLEDSALSGQTVTINATIKSIRERKLPELDDEFATQVDEELQTLQALRDRITEQLAASKKRAADQALRNMAISLIAQATDIDLPQELVDNVTAGQVESYMQYLQGQGLSPEQSVAAMQDEQEGVASQATEGLKLHYIFEEIAEAEAIEVDDAAIEAAIPAFAQSNDLDEQMVREAVQIHEEMETRLRNYARHERIIQILIDNAEIEEVPWEAYALRAKRHTEEYLAQLRSATAQADQPEASVSASEETRPPPDELASQAVPTKQQTEEEST